MQMLCLKNTDTRRAKRTAWWCAAALVCHAGIGFAADLTSETTPFQSLQTQAQEWAATHPSFKGKTLHVVPVDARVTVQNCQEKLQFEQPFPNQPAVRVRCTQPQWQLFVSLGAGNAPAPVNPAGPAAPVLHKVLVSKELLKRGTVITPAMFTTAEMPAAGMENQIISDSNVLNNMQLIRDLTPNTPLRSYDVRTAILVKRGQEVHVKAGEGQGFSITMRAEATQDGGLGDQIRLKNVESGRLLTGVITGPNEAKLR